MGSVVGGTGYRASEAQVIGQPRVPIANRRGVLYSHGAGAAPNTWTPDDYTKAGYPMFAGALGATLTQFGNDDAITATGAAWAYMKTAAGGSVKNDKLLLLGASMGATNLLSWAVQNAAAVAAIALVIPVLDIDDVYAGDKGGHRAAIATAYGVNARSFNVNTVNGSSTLISGNFVTADNDGRVIGNGIQPGTRITSVTNGVSCQTSLPANQTLNPSLLTVMPVLPGLVTHSAVAFSDVNKALLTMPIGIWASDDDPLASNTATCQAWAASVNAQGGSVTVTSMGAIGHTGNVPSLTYIGFLDSNGGRT